MIKGGRDMIKGGRVPPRPPLNEPLEPHVNLDINYRQGKETNLRALFSIFIEKKAAQVGFTTTTSCFQGSHSTN